MGFNIGKTEWTHHKAETKEYHVTGVDVYGKRFSVVYSSPYQAFGINLYRGSVWAVDHDNKRQLVRRVYN